MMIRTLIAAAAVGCLALPALAASGAPTTEPSTVTPVQVDAKKAKEDDKGRMVCKRQAPLGSRTPGKKVCRTAGEWEAEEFAAKEGLEDTTRRSLQSAPKM